MARPTTAVRESLDRHLESLGRLVDDAAVIDEIARRIADVLTGGGTILTCGNGGSAAEALHLAEELIGRFSRQRRPFAGLCLSADSTAITCISNDFGFEEVFARQIEGLGRKGDALVALTTSGKSPNVLRALERARKLGLTTIGLLGHPGSPAEALCDLALTPRVAAASHIQEAHLLAIHLILEYLDEFAVA
jgi:D-sedoheptulose 7-phosphate isomerase